MNYGKHSARAPVVNFSAWKTAGFLDKSEPSPLRTRRGAAAGWTRQLAALNALLRGTLYANT